MGLTLVDKDIAFAGKFKHSEEDGKWQSNYISTYIYKKAGNVETVNDLFFQFKENYGLYKYKNSSLYVSSGSGTWGPKIRLGSFNEVISIVLNPV